MGRERALECAELRTAALARVLYSPLAIPRGVIVAGFTAMTDARLWRPDVSGTPRRGSCPSLCGGLLTISGQDGKALRLQWSRLACPEPDLASRISAGCLIRGVVNSRRLLASPTEAGRAEF